MPPLIFLLKLENVEHYFKPYVNEAAIISMNSNAHVAQNCSFIFSFCS